MKTAFPGSFFLILILFFCSGTYAQKKLSYSFSVDTNQELVYVTLKLKGSARGKTVLKLPGEWAGREKLYRAVAELSVSGKNAVMEPLSDSSARTIVHKPGAELIVSYTLKQNWAGEVIYPNNFRAVIQETFFQFTGHSLFIFPEEMGNEKISIQLDWSELPQNWYVGNSLHSGSRKYKGKVRSEDLQNSVFIAGDFRAYKTNLNGKPVHIAIRGSDWQFADEKLVERVRAIISMERKFWNDYSEPYYFVSLIPFDGNGSANGTSLHQAFMLGMTYDMSLQDWLLTHEYFHRWNGTLMRLSENVEQEGSWFTEGFTEFYSYRLLRDNGILTDSAYYEKVNEMIASYYLSPVRDKDKKTLGTNYWKSSDFQQIPYKKGFVYALYIDNIIRSKSKQEYSLDNVMFDLYRDSKHKDSVTDADFISTVNHYTGTDISEDHSLYIDSGRLIPVLPMILGEEKDTAMKMMGNFDAGFDAGESFSSGIITGVAENSAAWEAGLRDGQELKGHSMWFGNALFPAEITITENGDEKLITFLPMSVDRKEVPQFKVAD